MSLSEARRAQLDGIVRQMIQNKESDSDIQFVVDDFSKKYQGENQPQTQQKPGFFQAGGALDKFGQAGSDISVGVVKGLGSTARNLARIAPTIASKITESIGQGKIEDPTKFVENALTPQNTAQKVGFGAEQIGEFLIPAGSITKAGKAVQALGKTSKIGKAVGLLGRGAVEATGTAGITATQGGDVKTGFILGGTLPIASKALGLLGSGAKEVAKYMSSTLSGTPIAAIEQAFKNPKIVQSAITKAASEGTEMTAQKIYNQAIKALDTLKKVRKDAYEQGLQTVENSLWKNKQGQLYVRRALSEVEAKATKGYTGGEILVPTNLSVTGLKNVASRTLKEFGAKAKGQSLDFSEMAIDKAHANKIQEVVDRVYEWENMTPTGLNKLTQILDGYRLGGINLGSSEKQFNAIIGKMKTNLADYVGERVPAIKDLRKNYAVQSKVIDDIVQQLKLGRGDPNTALRKLLNVFNPKSQVYAPVVKELGEKAGVDLMSDIAGLTMSQWTPQGLGKYLALFLGGAGSGASLLNPSALASLPITAVASSPKIIGKVATTAGKIAPTAKKITKKIGASAKAVIKGVATSR